MGERRKDSSRKSAITFEYMPATFGGFQNLLQSPRTVTVNPNIEYIPLPKPKHSKVNVHLGDIPDYDDIILNNDMYKEQDFSNNKYVQNKYENEQYFHNNFIQNKMRKFEPANSFDFQPFFPNYQTKVKIESSTFGHPVKTNNRKFPGWSSNTQNNNIARNDYALDYYTQDDFSIYESNNLSNKEVNIRSPESHLTSLSSAYINSEAWDKFLDTKTVVAGHDSVVIKKQ